MKFEDVPEQIRNISEITNEFHQAGVLGKDVILKMDELARDFVDIHSIETGCGKSTLLFSNISSKHLCFTLGTHGDNDDGSLRAVQASPHFEAATVEFILGPTQQTLPAYVFDKAAQIIFIDGPHGFPFPNLEYFFLYPQLVENGLLILDDIHIPTVGQLNDFLQDDDMFSHAGNVGTTAFFRRTASPLFDPFGDGWWLQNYNARRFSASNRKYSSNTARTRIYNFLHKCFGVAFADKVRHYYRRHS